MLYDSGLCHEVKSQYYHMFRSGYTAATAHLEYETNLMLSQDSPCRLADRCISIKMYTTCLANGEKNILE